MAKFYCILGDDFVAGRDGTDTGAEALTGPGGFQIAWRGGGAAGAEFKAGGLVAGDTLVVQGTAMTSRLVTLTLNAFDASAWDIGDTVQNDVGNGDHWTGKVVQKRDDVVTGLTNDQTVLIQLDSPFDVDDITGNLGDGVENTNKSQTDALDNAVSSPIIPDTNAGDGTTGHINIIGADGSWVERGGQAVLNADGQPSQCLLFAGKERLNFEYITFQNSAGNGVGTDGQTARFVIFRHCKFADNGGYGLDCNVDLTELYLQLCIFDNNTSAQLRANASRGRAVFCLFRNGSARGVLGAASDWVLYEPLLYNNNNDNMEFSPSNVSVFGGVSDGCVTGSGVRASSGTGVHNIVVGMRMTNNADHGFEVTNLVEDSNIEDFNVYHNNGNGDLQTVISGFHSYGDAANHIADPPNDGMVNSTGDHYEVSAGAFYSARNAADEIELNWDGSPAENNSVWITAGLAIEAPVGVGGGVGGGGILRRRG